MQFEALLRGTVFTIISWFLRLNLILLITHTREEVHSQIYTYRETENHIFPTNIILVEVAPNYVLSMFNPSILSEVETEKLRTEVLT